MKKRNVLSLLLSLTILLSVALPAATARAKDNSKGMEISKTATANSDGSYTITLEAYATGEKIISEITKDVPTDIILVLDQSSSMENDIGQVVYEPYEDAYYYRTRNQDYYECRHNGGSANLWYNLNDGSYVSVSVTKITPLNTTFKNYETDWRRELTSTCYYNYANSLYEKVGDGYKKVTLTEATSGSWLNTTYTYTYTFSDGTSVTSEGRNTSPNLGDHAPLYTSDSAADGDSTVYTYTYTDSTGAVKTIGTSTGENTQYTPPFYQRTTSTSGGGSRLNALKTAVKNFAAAVNEKAKGKDQTYGTTDDINHRIAVVGFASGSTSYNSSYPAYLNSEVFIGANQYNYNENASSYYSTAFQNMNTQAGYDNVIASKNALDAAGATHVDLGIEMANGIFKENPLGQTEKRNRVVIVFTDGSPSSWQGYNSTVANAAIEKARTTKETYGATVYTVGIFSGADATSAGRNDNRADEAQRANWFMQNLSSNNGTVRSPSYYLSAGDAASLNNIFQQISSNIETGGSSTTLGESTVIRDIISPQFTLPEGTKASDITLETYACTGKSANGDYTWRNNDSTMGATASITGDQVSVTGFDFAENYVGTVTQDNKVTYRGSKLVISFTVEPRPGFLGGNNVFTNDGAGIYETADSEKPLLTFEQPTVNVPIEEVTVEAKDKNVYLMGEVTADQLKAGAKIKVGDVELNLAKAKDNYGLEEWQTKYVDITVTVKDKDGNPVSEPLEGLTEDTTYTVEVTVSPKNGSTSSSKGTPAKETTGESKPANIFVFKPELTFKDSTAYYGESVPAKNNYSGNKVGSETWKHGDTASTDPGVTMLGKKPTLDISYTPDERKLEGGKYTKQDVPVKATVSIDNNDVTSNTTFVHQGCTEKSCALPEGQHFWIHIQTCTLKIEKTGGADDESYVFDVYKGDTKYSEVTIWGNGTETLVELPIGTYTIKEDTGWSWRYTANNGDRAELTAKNPTGSITCTNSSNGKNQWLNGFSKVVRNIFGTNR